MRKVLLTLLTCTLLALTAHAAKQIDDADDDAVHGGFDIQDVSYAENGTLLSVRLALGEVLPTPGLMTCAEAACAYNGVEMRYLFHFSVEGPDGAVTGPADAASYQLVAWFEDVESKYGFYLRSLDAAGAVVGSKAIAGSAGNETLAWDVELVDLGLAASRSEPYAIIEPFAEVVGFGCYDVDVDAGCAEGGQPDADAPGDLKSFDRAPDTGYGPALALSYVKPQPEPEPEPEPEPTPEEKPENPGPEDKAPSDKSDEAPVDDVAPGKKSPAAPLLLALMAALLVLRRQR